MRRPYAFIPAHILAWLLCAAVAGVVLAQSAGGTRGGSGRPPTRGPESGLLGGKGPTTKPGSHESAVKDERDRIAGKFPAPKEKNSSGEEGRAAGAASAAYVDVVVLEPERQAVTLTRDDFRVAIDGEPRRVVAVHYVFRGPQALDAGRSIPVGKGVIARADEARTIVLVVDETTFAAGTERTLAPALEQVLAVIGPDDRAAVVPLPQPGPLKFATTRTDLSAGLARISGRGSPRNGADGASLDALTRLLQNLVKLEGPKNIIYFAASSAAATRRVSDGPDLLAPHISSLLHAAAASRTVVHVISAGQRDSARPPYLHTLAASTGGTVTRLAGGAHDLAALAGALLGGYVLQVEGRVTDRDGAAHALAVTTTARGVRVLAPARWMPRYDPLPAPVARVRP